jgi:hypothetical protein
VNAAPEFLACRYALPRLQLPEIAPVAPILVEFLPDLMRHNGKLLSGSKQGVAVHAGTFLRERRMVLETALLEQPGELRRILIHELFHFIWMRLGNQRRNSWREILANEANARARGELGWSAEHRKRGLQSGQTNPTSRAWLDYTCESFCDTAAWRNAGLAQHDEFTLARRWQTHRAAYFEGLERQPLAL